MQIAFHIFCLGEFLPVCLKGVFKLKICMQITALNPVKHYLIELIDDLTEKTYYRPKLNLISSPNLQPLSKMTH